MQFRDNNSLMENWPSDTSNVKIKDSDFSIFISLVFKARENLVLKLNYMYVCVCVFF